MRLLQNPKILRLALNLYPPYLGTGISVRRIASDWRDIEVRLKLRWYNRNYVGTHFGGSLAAMTDPFYMLMLMNVLGPAYMVWDKVSRIEFVQPGRGVVGAHFSLSDAEIDQIRRETEAGAKCLKEFEVPITDSSGELIARVDKTIYIRRKKTQS